MCLHKLTNAYLLSWAVSTVMTRQNFIPSDDNETKVAALIPLWDLCNHTNGMISTDFNPELSRSECLALTDFKKGEQLFIFYGPRTNAEFFIHNGFIPSGNVYDSYPIKLGISKCDPLKEKRILLLRKLGLENTQEFKLRIGENPIDGKLLAFLRIFNMSQDQLDHWVESNRSGDLEFIECALDVSLEKKSWCFLQTRLKLMLATYQTTLEEDKKLLEENKSSSNTVLAVKMRASEKEIIWNTLNWLEQHVQQ
ncbi:actin-histidine N-methyltransferase isoform X2 [Coccinella septempunctata]|uniref:actin-histidine N-methyltransferase isoform X2 n=1 Tax=Coccinella septempunctata TaxID=41139 RepID=UPI001D07F526|nr:actin-histidine N-methyltransferase isoform X2 [Coccinella septempunctata]